MSLENDIQELTAAVIALTKAMQGRETVSDLSSKIEIIKPKAEVAKPVEPKVETTVAEEIVDPLADMKLPNGKTAKRFLELSDGGKGRERQASLLKQFGAKTVKDIKVEDVAAFAGALEAAFVEPEPVVEEVKPEVLEGELMDKDSDKPFEVGSPEFEAHFNRTDGLLAVPYIAVGIEKQKILCAQFGIAKLSLLPRGRVGEMLEAIEGAA